LLQLQKYFHVFSSQKSDNLKAKGYGNLFQRNLESEILLKKRVFFVVFQYGFFEASEVKLKFATI